MAQPRKTKKQNNSWQTIAQEAQDYRDASMRDVQLPMSQHSGFMPQNVLYIPAAILSEAEVTITESTPEDLVSALATGKLSAREVTLAFLHQAAIAQRLVSGSRVVSCLLAAK